MDKELIGKRLYTLRVEKLKISQSVFAKKIGIAQNNYTAVENGKLNLTIKHLYNIGVNFGANNMAYVILGE